jgi:hypothetical protein
MTVSLQWSLSEVCALHVLARASKSVQLERISFLPCELQQYAGEHLWSLDIRDQQDYLEHLRVSFAAYADVPYAERVQDKPDRE